MSASDLRAVLIQQFAISWELTQYHLQGLTTEDCLRRPAALGLHVQPCANGWVADWPEHEGYDIGPASIAWLLWHMSWWWASVLDHVEGDGTLQREHVQWSGTAEDSVALIHGFAARWQTLLERMSDEDLYSTTKPRWPQIEGPFANVVAWLNVELMKNGAEIGYARFVLGASR